jgi:predicted Zn-dependent protease
MNRRTASCLAIALLCAFPAATCSADEVADLKARVTALEKRCEDLEKKLTTLLARSQSEGPAAPRAKARERMRRDAETFTPQQLREIESLYQVANQNWQTETARKSLRKLVEKYTKANRTGCAVLYLGQMSEGDAQISYLKRAIADHSDCFYGDGVQVGAFARLLLAQVYLKNNAPEKAQPLLDEIRKNYPDAIDHDGRPLAAR